VFKERKNKVTKGEQKGTNWQSSSAALPRDRGGDERRGVDRIGQDRGGQDR
jgi:hypothetical protein